jgi:hypothetical protein
MASARQLPKDNVIKSIGIIDFIDIVEIATPMPSCEQFVEFTKSRSSSNLRQSLPVGRPAAVCIDLQFTKGSLFSSGNALNSGTGLGTRGTHGHPHLTFDLIHIPLRACPRLKTFAPARSRKMRVACRLLDILFQSDALPMPGMRQGKRRVIGSHTRNNTPNSR